MKKSEMRAATRDEWRVTDDFGQIGTVLSIAGPEHLHVHWDGDKEPSPVHYGNVDRFHPVESAKD